MRSVFALGLLIILCVSADAATVHRSKPSTVHFRARQLVIVRPSQGVTAPARFAVVERRSRHPSWLPEIEELLRPRGYAARRIWQSEPLTVEEFALPER